MASKRSTLFVRALALYGGGWDGKSPYPVLYFRMLKILVKTESEGYHVHKLGHCCRSKWLLSVYDGCIHSTMS